MKIYVKKFTSLSLNELFSIVQAREQVFHLEQKITEAEYDEIDKIAYHMYLVEEEHQILSYIRLYKDEEGTYRLGRFLSTVRNKGYGKIIFNAALDYIINHWGGNKIVIHAQSYLIKFYEKFGFKVTSEPFDEAGIEHVEMIFAK